jgi:hypothetical protein
MRIGPAVEVCKYLRIRVLLVIRSQFGVPPGCGNLCKIISSSNVYEKHIEISVFFTGFTGLTG